ncbi:Bromodomain-containing protein [Auriculariales sp. MPI-PUGE-AT-0066]|nr:Bromodomain-containing protein [Auriculariales sp. MPI-PUGE-AT-0066]
MADALLTEHAAGPTPESIPQLPSPSPSPPSSVPPTYSDVVVPAPDPSIVAVIATPPDPDSIPIHPPHGTPPPPTGELLPEVEMAEAAPPAPASVSEPVAAAAAAAAPVENGVNGHTDHSVDMHIDPEPDVQVPFDQPMTDTSLAAHPLSPPSSVEQPMYGAPNGHVSAGSVRPYPDEADDDDLPPAKRARHLSDADVASLSHSLESPTATLTDEQRPAMDGSSTDAASFTTTVADPASHTLTTPQHRFMISTVRSLKRVKEAAPFLHPVDPEALAIPHYPAIVKTPMDLGTVERKVVASNPMKPDLSSPRYRSAQEFATDVRLIFNNCLLFNGPDHLVTQMGKRVEAIFDKQFKNMPSNDDFHNAKKETSPLPPAPVPIPPKKARRVSSAHASAPAAVAPRPVQHKLTDPNAAVNHRPKREVHPPAPADIGFTDMPKRTRVRKSKNNASAEQLKFCSKLLSELFKKQYWSFASPFYEPVDWQKLEIPSYPKIIKKPMDLTTMRRKLDRNEYDDAVQFFADFKLMIRNCFTFNPTGTVVSNAGHQLQDLFDDKWKALPVPRDALSDNDNDFDEMSDDSDNDHDDAIHTLTQQLESVKSNIAALQSKKKKRRDEKRRSKPAGSVPKASSSKAFNPANGAPKKKGKSKAQDVDEVLSFEQKRELSETIGLLEGAKLERVIQIIHEGVPEIRDSKDEIELDIDTLPAHVLIKLYNTVMRPIKAKPGGRAAQRNGAGTGGLKRKSMDEEAEAERIRLLEERIQLFDKHQNGGSGNPNGTMSDSSSDSDSSGSDSD